jgi:hypothetical protein
MPIRKQGVSLLRRFFYITYRWKLHIINKFSPEILNLRMQGILGMKSQMPSCGLATVEIMHILQCET